MMTNLTDTASAWEAGVYQIETTDPVLGGPPNPATGAGMSNIPHLQLAKRTQWLKAQVEQLQTGGGYRSAETLGPVNITLTASDMGKCLIYGDTTAITITLPLISATPVGSIVDFVNTSTVGVTIQRQGTDMIDIGPSTASSIVIPPNQSLRVIRATGTSNWHLFGITAQALQSTMQASLADNGWQKLPSGLIIQWGSVTTASTAQAGTITASFPMTFPGGTPFWVMAFDPNSGISTNPFQVGTYSQTASQVTIGWYRLAGTGSPQNINWMAMGT